MQALISGASGTIGTPLVQSLLSRNQSARVVCVLRSAGAMQELRDALSASQQERVEFLQLDLTDTARVEALALQLAPRGPMVGIHLAADVSWDKSCEQLLQVNVQGTQNFCRLLTALSNHPRLIFVSTAYTRTHDWVYRNGYEESKALAERTLRERFGPTLPISTFSCSLVVGDSVSGQIGRFNGLYPLIKFIAAFNPPFLVGNKDGLFDIVPRDWVVAELLHMVLACEQASEPPEVVASAGAQRIRYEDVVRLMEQRLAAARAHHGLPAAAPVPILRERQWGFLKRSLAAWQPPGISTSDFRYFERLLQVYGAYASSDRVRAPLNIVSPAPNPAAFLPKVVDYWISRNPRVLHSRFAGVAA